MAAVEQAASEYSEISGQSESVRGLQLRGPYSTQLTTVRQIFNIPLWYHIDEAEFQVYKDLINEGGVGGPKVARVLQCSTVDDCACYFCQHVDVRPRSPSSSLSGSAWSPVNGQVADQNGSPIIPQYRVNSDGYHVEVSPSWPFSGPLLNKREYSNQTSPQDSPLSTPRRPRRGKTQPRRLFSPYRRPSSPRAQDRIFTFPRPSTSHQQPRVPASPSDSSPGAFRECYSPPVWTIRPRSRVLLRCPCNTSGERAWISLIAKEDPVQRTADWVADHMLAEPRETSTPIPTRRRGHMPLVYEW